MSAQGETPDDRRGREWQVFHALRRSRARRIVLAFLAKNQACYPSSIARQSGLDLPSTLGALRGLGARYTQARSLVEMGLVREHDGLGRGNMRIYALTDAGRLFWQRHGDDLAP